MVSGLMFIKVIGNLRLTDADAKEELSILFGTYQHFALSIACESRGGMSTHTQSI